MREFGILALAALPGVERSPAATALPVPCATGSCVNGPSTWLGSGKATFVQSANTLTVKQSSANATLNWASFNVGADGKVVYQQPGATSIALNRIFSASPSNIFGQVTANGQIYLLNANGIIFGPKAQVNVGSMIASSLNISDSTFQSGILAPSLLANNQAVLQPFVDAQGNPILSGSVTVQQGAQLTAASGGRLMLAAPTVQNAGTLTAPEGQVILAAGQKVYLAASTDASLAGLVVEVDSGGTAANQLTGLLSAAQGNVSMVGLAVNQDGRISATTSVTANGSVRLEAGDTAAINGTSPKFSLSSTQGGTVTLGPQSQIDVLPDTGNTATADASIAQQQSTISILGQQVIMQGGQIKAPDGVLNVLAAANPGAGVVTNGNTNARVRIDPGTVIDLSGTNTQLPMDANLLSVQLLSNELADDPTQRNGALHGQTVVIDTRVGTDIIGSTALAQAEGGVQQSIAYRTTAGGSAHIQSEGDIVLAKGATVNVSGGAVTYSGGQIQTTELVGADGRLYNIGTANPLLTYTGVVNPTFTKTYDQWGVQQVIPSGSSHFEQGYVQGSSAGTVQFAAPDIIVNGSLIGHATNGALQRSGSTTAAGGTLIIGETTGTTVIGNISGFNDFLSPAVTLVTQAPNIVVADDAALPGPLTLQLPTSYITSGGFMNTQIYSNSQFSLPAGQPLNLGPGGSLLVDARIINVLSNITAPGGTVNLQSVQTILSPDPTQPRAGIQIGDGVTIDVRGQWTNDWQSSSVPVGLTLQNGGTIDLGLGGLLPGVDPEQLVVGNNVDLRASGGAWLGSSGTVTAGAGGHITLDAGSLQSAIAVGKNLGLDAFGTVGAAGGSFSLTAPSVEISQGTGTAWTSAQRVDSSLATDGSFQVFAPLFNQYGFSSVSITASEALPAAAASPDLLKVDAGTSIVAEASSLQLQSGYLTRPSGGTVAGFSQPILLPNYLRPATQVALSVAQRDDIFPITIGTDVFGTLDVERGALIQVDPGASAADAISLTAGGSVIMNGTLRAPAGSVTLQIPGLYLSSDPGYLPDQQLLLGAKSTIDVSGTSVFTPNNGGLLLGEVFAGGSVNLFADRGYVVAEPGSLINISGASASVDQPNRASPTGYSRAQVGSAGGALSIRSPESVSLLGSVAAGAGTSAIGQPAGGALNIELSRNDQAWFQPQGVLGDTFPTLTPLYIEFVGSTLGYSPLAPDSNAAQLGVSQLAASGFASLNLKADGSIQFATNMPLSLAGSLTLDSPVFAVPYGNHASLSAPIVALGNSQAACTGCMAASGTGSFNLSGQNIELFGQSVFDGAQGVTLTSSGDVQLRAVSVSAGAYLESFSVGMDLTINAARVYPNTDTVFSLTSAGGTGSGGTVAIGQTGASPGTPLSAGGAIDITADQIVNAGTLLAPFGSIVLNATTSIDLVKGSTVSVSGAGLLLPYGLTELGGVSWLDPLTLQPIAAIPTRSVQITAPSVNFAKGATVNLQGGGDLYAYEWVPGTGGTTDALAGNASGLYAILPTTRGQYAPYDPNYYLGSSLTAGQSVYLSGIAGLAAGMYPLLPARYALLPGAFLVQAEPTYQSLVPGHAATLADGTPVIAGYFAVGDTGLRNPGYIGFAVHPGSYGQLIAEYQNSDATTFFSQLAASTASSASSPAPHVDLPADAGSLSFSITGGNFDAAGNVLSAAASGGQAASIDLSASNLELTGNSNTTVAAGTVSLSAALVQSWDPGLLTIGGHPNSDGTLTVESNSVTIGSGASLAADQIVIVAGQSIDVQSGAFLASSSGAAGGAAPKNLPAGSSISLTGALAPGAAWLAVSDLSLPTPVRPAAPDVTPVSAGTLTLEAGSTLSSQGALALDAPGTVNVAGTINGKGANWWLGSSSIAFAGPASSSSDTLQIGSPLLTQLRQAGAVTLSSLGSIDLLTSVSLGAKTSSSTPTLSSLTLIGTELNNLASADSTFGAKTLSLQGPAASIDPVALGSEGTGTLSLVAGELDIGAGTMSINGFSNTRAQVSGAVVGHGTGGLQVAGDLLLSAAQVTAAGEADTTISAPQGTLTITSPASGASTPTLATNLGGALTLAANNVNDSGKVVVSAGPIAIQATQNLNVTGAAVLDASGLVVSAGTQSEGAPGGSINLSAGGDLNLASTAELNVSGAMGAPAGAINVQAAGSATMGAVLKGSAGTGQSGGSFSLEAGSLLTPFTALSTNLLAGGFTNSIGVRTHSGDLVLAAGGVTRANHVTLTADTGLVDVAGDIVTVAGTGAGAISLFGGEGVTLESTGQLHADTSNNTGRGGTIELGTTSLGASATSPGTPGIINLAPGSIVSAVGSTANGELLLRAPALAATNDISIGSLGANLTGVGQVVLEPVTQFFADASNPIDFGVVATQLTNYLNGATPIINARLNPQGSSAITILPGVEIQQTGDFILNQSLDLNPGDAGQSAWQYSGGPVDLTVRATGSVILNGSISDGFTIGNNGTAFSGQLVSSSLRFVAGADLNSANPLAVNVGSTAANFVLGSGAVVRTGTGDIDVVAAGNVDLSAAFGAAPSIYTGGIDGAPQQTVRLSNSVFTFPTGGGNIAVQAGQDVDGSSVAQAVSLWQLRQGNPTTPAQWGVDLNKFAWNFGTLGGGDLSITAARDIANVSAAAADSLYAGGTSGTSSYFAGGGLAVTAGRDVNGAQFFVADGKGNFTAGRSFLNTLLNLGDAQISVDAREDIGIQGVLNPTVLAQGSRVPRQLAGNYFTYGSDSSLSLRSTAGNITLDNNNSPFVGDVNIPNGSAAELAYPASLSISALSQNIQLGPNLLGIVLFPSDTGQLTLFAGLDIVGVSNYFVSMSDAPATDVPTAQAPGQGSTELVTQPVSQGGVASGRHAGDSNPILVTAGRDILNLYLDVPKPAQVAAGRDIVNLEFAGQNLAASDVTWISAGRDFVDQAGQGGEGAQVQLGGPGSLDVFAGRDINLGFSPGIITVGNSLNPNLPTANGAALTVLAGLGQAPDYSTFYSSIIQPSSAYQLDLVNFVESQTGQSGLTVPQADSLFTSMGSTSQLPFINSVFFDELVASGIEANESSLLGFNRGYAAIDALFPNSRTPGSATLASSHAASSAATNPYQGDLTLDFSRLYTLKGGSITLLVPGGAIDVGLASPPANVPERSASQLGIVAEGAGDVDIYSQGNVLVNASRIFTLGGGNITIWSNEGNIDAGRGAKTSISAPPPQVLVSSNGTVTVDFSGAVAGSGIRTIQIDPDAAPGNVNLIAPVGTVNAGDAGIGAAGNINIAAAAVLGASNINFGGTATGVPAQVSSLGASLSAASSTSSGASSAATSAVNGAANENKEAAPLAQAAIGWLDVFVTGLGEDACKPDDMECLKHEKK